MAIIIFGQPFIDEEEWCQNELSSMTTLIPKSDLGFVKRSLEKLAIACY
ncbi:MAG: hypothetical protein ACXVNO_01660 [Bacteroidia bacterium]